MAHRFWGSLTLPVFAASGNQAYSVLTLLDTNQLPRLRSTMEAEIDHTLGFLESTKADGRLLEGSPELKVYQRLRKYRDTHKWQSSAEFADKAPSAQGPPK
jgi:hypothetical protein